MRIIDTSNKFKKDLSRLKKRGKNLSKMENALVRAGTHSDLF